MVITTEISLMFLQSPTKTEIKDILSLSSYLNHTEMKGFLMLFRKIKKLYFGI